MNTNAPLKHHSSYISLLVLLQDLLKMTVVAGKALRAIASLSLEQRRETGLQSSVETFRSALTTKQVEILVSCRRRMSGAEERRLSQEESGEGERARSKKEKEKEKEGSKEKEKGNDKEKEEGKDTNAQNKNPAAAVEGKVTDDKVTANPLSSPKKDASTDPLEDPGALNMC